MVGGVKGVARNVKTKSVGYACFARAIFALTAVLLTMTQQLSTQNPTMHNYSATGVSARIAGKIPELIRELVNH